MGIVDKELPDSKAIRSTWAPGLWVMKKNLRTADKMYFEGARRLEYLKNKVSSANWKVGEIHPMYVGFTQGDSTNLSGLSKHVYLKLTDNLPN